MNNLQSLIWIFPLAITLHNIEEALWLPKWSQETKGFTKPVDKQEFHFALICVTLLAYLATFLYGLYDRPLWKYIYFGYMGAMIINAIFPHLIATIVLKKYAPGVVTGVLLNLPSFGLLTAHAVHNGILSIGEIVLSTAIAAVILLTMLPLLFKAGLILIVRWPLEK